MQTLPHRKKRSIAKKQTIGMTQAQHFRNFRWEKLMGVWEQRKVNLKAAVEREKAVQAIVGIGNVRIAWSPFG
jgi:hypothetical protein